MRQRVGLPDFKASQMALQATSSFAARTIARWPSGRGGVTGSPIDLAYPGFDRDPNPALATSIRAGQYRNYRPLDAEDRAPWVGVPRPQNEGADVVSFGEK
jgi:hypothetical protein